MAKFFIIYFFSILYMNDRDRIQFSSETIFYGDLVYKFKSIGGKPNFSDQFKKIIKRYKN